MRFRSELWRLLHREECVARAQCRRGAEGGWRLLSLSQFVPLRLGSAEQQKRHAQLLKMASRARTKSAAARSPSPEPARRGKNQLAPADASDHIQDEDSSAISGGDVLIVLGLLLSFFFALCRRATLASAQQRFSLANALHAYSSTQFQSAERRNLNSLLLYAGPSMLPSSPSSPRAPS